MSDAAEERALQRPKRRTVAAVGPDQNWSFRDISTGSTRATRVGLREFTYTRTLQPGQCTFLNFDADVDVDIDSALCALRIAHPRPHLHRHGAWVRDAHPDPLAQQRHRLSGSYRRRAPRHSRGALRSAPGDPVDDPARGHELVDDVDLVRQDPGVGIERAELHPFGALQPGLLTQLPQGNRQAIQSLQPWCSTSQAMRP